MSVPNNGSGYQQFGPNTAGAGEACEKTLLRANDTDVTIDNFAQFEVATPDVAAVALVRVSVRCPSGGGINPNFVASYGVGNVPYRWPARLFLTSSLRDRGSTVPTPSRAFAGSSASPLVIPTSPDLWGYEQEIETAGNTLFGCLIVGGDVSAASALGGSDFSVAKSKPPVGFDWIVSVRYNARVPISAESWRELCGAAGVSVLQGGNFLK